MIRDNYKHLRFPYTPTNPSGGVTVQVGVKDHAMECQTVVPPGVLIFGRRKNNGDEKTGHGINRVAVGHTRQPDDGSFNAGQETMVPIGVSMDGIVDPSNVEGNLDSNGRYSIAIGGSVTLCAVTGNDPNRYVMPKVLDTLYVDPINQGITVMDYCGKSYIMPKFSTSKITGVEKKIGVVTWVNDNFQTDRIAEVRVHLDIEN